MRNSSTQKTTYKAYFPVFDHDTGMVSANAKMTVSKTLYIFNKRLNISVWKSSYVFSLDLDQNAGHRCLHSYKLDAQERSYVNVCSSRLLNSISFPVCALTELLTFVPLRNSSTQTFVSVKSLMLFSQQYLSPRHARNVQSANKWWFSLTRLLTQFNKTWSLVASSHAHTHRLGQCRLPQGAISRALREGKERPLLADAIVPAKLSVHKRSDQW